MIYIRHCQDSNSQPVSSQAGRNASRFRLATVTEATWIAQNYSQLWKASYLHCKYKSNGIQMNFYFLKINQVYQPPVMHLYNWNHFCSITTQSVATHSWRFNQLHAPITAFMLHCSGLWNLQLGNPLWRLRLALRQQSSYYIITLEPHINADFGVHKKSVL